MNNFLKDFTSRIECYGTDCSIRYYLNDTKDLALGVVRAKTIKTTGKIPQVIVTIVSMDLDSMLSYIMMDVEYEQDCGEDIIKSIRVDASDKIKEYLTNNNI